MNTPTRDGWWNMACWNGLSPDQQRRLLAVGNLPIDYVPGGTCERRASVAVETEHDVAPGPRFYCVPCAVAYVLDTEQAALPSPAEVEGWFGPARARVRAHRPTSDGLPRADER